MPRCILACTLWLLAATLSLAQESFEQTYAKMISDDVAQEAIQRALSNIHGLRCDANRPCEPASAAERANPPITVEHGRAAMVTAIKSALAEWCGINWKRSYDPMIELSKTKLKMNDRQIRLMAMVHADFYARQLAFYTKNGQCPANLRDQLDSQLPKL